MHGSAWLHYADRRGSIPLAAGKVVFLLPDVPHRLAPSLVDQRACAVGGSRPRERRVSLQPLARLSTVASPSPAASSGCTPPCRTRSCRSSSSGRMAAAAICAMPGPASTPLARSRIHSDRSPNAVQLGRNSPFIRAAPPRNAPDITRAA
nr:hypothetical protein [Burkholderia vietnamiensis]